MTLANRLRNATLGRNLFAPVLTAVLTAATVPVFVAASHAQTPAATMAVLTPKQNETLGTNKFNLDVRFKSLTNAPIVTAELWVDGVRWVRRDLDSPRRASVLSFLVDGSTLPAGAHTIVVKVLNAEGNASSAKLNIVAGSDDATGDTSYGGPDIRFVSPGNGKKVVGTVELLVDAKTRNGAQTFVTFFVDDKFKTMKNYPPYSFAWDTTNETNGVHTVTASGYLDSTNQTTTRKITVVVNNPGGYTKRASEIPDLSAPKTATTATVAKPLAIPLPRKAEAAIAAPMGEARVSESTVATLAPAESLGLAATVATASVTAAPRLSVPTVPVAKSAPVTAKATPQIAPVVAATAVPAPGSNPVLSAASDVSLDISPAATFAELATLPIAAPRTSDAAPRLARPVAPVKVAVATVAAPMRSVSAPVVTAIVKPAAPRTSVAAPKAVIVASAKRAARQVIVAKPLQVAFDGERIAFDVAPRVEAGMPVAPFRQIFEHTGGKVSWANNTKTMRAVNADREIVIGVGKSSALVNGKSVSMDRAATLTRGRTVVPLNFVGQALDVDVKYDAATGRLSITSKN